MTVHFRELVQGFHEVALVKTLQTEPGKLPSEEAILALPEGRGTHLPGMPRTSTRVGGAGTRPSPLVRPAPRSETPRPHAKRSGPICRQIPRAIARCLREPCVPSRPLPRAPAHLPGPATESCSPHSPTAFPLASPQSPGDPRSPGT